MISHLHYDQQITEADDDQWSEEAHCRGIDDEGCRPHILWLRPDHVTGVESVLKKTTHE